MNIINCTIANNYPEFYINNSEVNIINSIFWDDSKIVIVRGDTSLPVSHVRVAFSDLKGGKNQIQAKNDSLYYEDTNIVADPLFKNISNSNYALSEGSPCINSGTNFYQIRDKVIVNLKEGDYYGKAPDIGVYESNYTSSKVNENITNLSLMNFPNPFNSTTIVHYSLSKFSHVHLAVYSITGQKVMDLLDKFLPAGTYQAQWNGTDKSGKTISSGIYIVKLDSGFILFRNAWFT